MKNLVFPRARLRTCSGMVSSAAMASGEWTQVLHCRRLRTDRMADDGVNTKVPPELEC